MSTKVILGKRVFLEDIFYNLYSSLISFWDPTLQRNWSPKQELKYKNYIMIDISSHKSYKSVILKSISYVLRAFFAFIIPTDHHNEIISLILRQHPIQFWLFIVNI